MSGESPGQFFKGWSLCTGMDQMLTARPPLGGNAMKPHAREEVVLCVVADCDATTFLVRGNYLRTSSLRVSPL